MIEINNLTALAVDKKFLKSVAGKILKGEKKEKKDLSVALVGPAQIKQLNKRYRRKDKTTDILSFAGEGSFLGEIVICPQQVRKNAQKYKVSFKKELTQVLIHGILHLLGYDHERSQKEAKKMEKRQQYYL